MMKKAVLFFLILFVMLTLPVSAQEGKDIFERKCDKCHSLVLSTILCKFDIAANWDAPFLRHLPSNPAPSLAI